MAFFAVCDKQMDSRNNDKFLFHFIIDATKAI